jgi:hypothetical protein
MIMQKNNYKMSSVRAVKFAGMLLGAFMSAQVQALSQMTDSEMTEVTGQALFVADTIVGAGLGAGVTYTRVGLDVELGLNAQINKWQLGCGGFNESVVANACDIDMDFVTLMGRNGTGPADNSPGAIGSDFLLTRPYLEIATKGSGSTREVVGIKIGAQTTNGFFGVGRRYNINQVNLENGGTCTTGTPLNCHSGLNRLSGYINAELSGQFPVSITLLGTQTACFGRTTINASCPMSNAPVTAEAIGTRMNNIFKPSIPLTLSAGFLSAIGIDQAYATIDQDLRMMHGFALNNTSDFFLSFQRERLYYPSYTTNSSTAAGSQSYSQPTNAGWWMNVPSLKVTDLQGATVSLGIGDALSALSAPGPTVTDSELNQSPPSNCWGSNKFC